MNHHAPIKNLALFFSFGMLAALMGCSGGNETPELGTAEGTVKLDGQPVVGATVLFQPENGRPSEGTTDGEGHYAAMYKPDVEGAVVGKHTVRIHTKREGDPGAEDEAMRVSVPEKIPAKYNANSQLTAEVKAGTNEPFDFNLDSKGEIIQSEDGEEIDTTSCGQ